MMFRRGSTTVRWRDLFPGMSTQDLQSADPSTDLGGGVSDHGLLAGLGDDDHAQYLNNTRGDARYYTKAQLKSNLEWQVPSTAKAINMPRLGTFSLTLAALTSGRLLMVGIPLKEGDSISSLTFVSGSTALSGGTNHWFALYDQNLGLLRQTADQGAAAWAANTIKTLNLSSAHVATYTGLHYAGIMVAATTVPTMLGMNGNATLNGLRTPVLIGQSTTGLTTTAPATAAALTTSVSALPYCEAA